MRQPTDYCIGREHSKCLCARKIEKNNNSHFYVANNTEIHSECLFTKKVKLNWTSCVYIEIEVQKIAVFLGKFGLDSFIHWKISDLGKKKQKSFPSPTVTVTVKPQVPWPRKTAWNWRKNQMWMVFWWAAPLWNQISTRSYTQMTRICIVLLGITIYYTCSRHRYSLSLSSSF